MNVIYVLKPKNQGTLRLHSTALICSRVDRKNDAPQTSIQPGLRVQVIANSVANKTKYLVASSQVPAL